MCTNAHTLYTHTQFTHTCTHTCPHICTHVHTHTPHTPIQVPSHVHICTHIQDTHTMHTPHTCVYTHIPTYTHHTGILPCAHMHTHTCACPRGHAGAAVTCSMRALCPPRALSGPPSLRGNHLLIRRVIHQPRNSDLTLGFSTAWFNH